MAGMRNWASCIAPPLHICALDTLYKDLKGPDMTTDTVRYDLVEIDARARQMRADMISAGLRRAVAWLRAPRAAGTEIVGKPA